MRYCIQVILKPTRKESLSYRPRKWSINSIWWFFWECFSAVMYLLLFMQLKDRKTQSIKIGVNLFVQVFETNLVWSKSTPYCYNESKAIARGISFFTDCPWTHLTHSEQRWYKWYHPTRQKETLSGMTLNKNTTSSW